MHFPNCFVRLSTLACVGLLVSPALQLPAQDQAQPDFKTPAAKAVPKVAAPAVRVGDLKPGSQSTEQTEATLPAPTPQQIADESDIRRNCVAFMKAYCAADAKAVASHFSENAEYVDEQGAVIQGRAAIEKSLEEYFAENPECHLEVAIDSLRFVNPNVAIEDGTTTLLATEVSAPLETHYTTVHVKTDGKWLAVSIRDRAPKSMREHQVQLEQLNWLLGDWVDEGHDAVVAFACEPADGGNFLMRKFAVHIAGEEAMSGSQRIGWDPLTGKLRTWIFDSEGGYGQGQWHRHGDNWVLKLTGVTADGESASSTSMYTLVNEHMMTWQSIDQEIGGIQLPDGDVITVVRRAPVPELTDAP